ncbi:hypothetical protein ABPG74_012645 [Tetrahymena malaccensis]
MASCLISRIRKENINKVMKKTKLDRGEINLYEEVYYDSDSESHKEKNQSNANQQSDSHQLVASCDNQQNNQIYQDSPKSLKLKASSKSVHSGKNSGSDPLISKNRKKNTKKSKDVPLIKAICKKYNEKQKKKSKQQKWGECFVDVKDDHDHHDEMEAEENIEIKQSDLKTVMDRFKQYSNEMFDSEFFEEVAQLANSCIFEKKYTIVKKDIKQFTAFLLYTSICKMSHISDYFNNPFSKNSNIISRELFFFISSCLSSKNQNLHELSNLLEKKIIPDEIEYSFLHENSSQSKQSIQNPQLIQSNYLDFFSDYMFDFYNKVILINPSYYEKDTFLQTNQCFSSINIHQKKVNKVSFKHLRDQILQKKTIFNHSASVLKSTENSIPDLLYNQQINKSEKQIEIEDKNDSFEDKKQYSFNYNPKTLQLISIQQVELNSQVTYNGKLHSKSKQNKQISSQVVYQIDSSNPNANIMQKLIFEDNDDPLNSQLLKIYNKYRPLANIKLDEMESLQLRAYSEVVFSMCIQTFQKAILRTLEQETLQRIDNFIQLERMFLDFQYLLIESIQPTKQWNNPSIEIIVKRHSLQKKKHCNFCIVCKYYHMIELERNYLKKFQYQKPDQLPVHAKKTKYECLACSNYYKRNISLCVEQCDKEFHSNPSKFLIGKSIKKKYNLNNVLNKMDQIEMGQTIEQLDKTEKVLEEVISKISHDRIIALDCVSSLLQTDKKGKKAQKYQEQQEQEVEYNNQFFPNDIIEQVVLRYPNNQNESEIQEEKVKNQDEKIQVKKEDSDTNESLKNENVKKQQPNRKRAKAQKPQKQFVVKQESQD